MIRTSIFAILVAANAIALPTIESSQLQGSGSIAFSIPTIPKLNHFKNGRAAIAKAHAKYGSTKFTKRQTGSFVAAPEDGGAEYTCQVKIGSTGQTLNMDFDTGSSDLWVFYNKQPASQQRKHHVFNPSKSKSFKNLTGNFWDISYGDGSSASGTVGTDVVRIGSATISNAIELATTVSGSFIADTDSDGIVGLAFSNINTVHPQKQKTLIDSAIIQNKLARPLFAANLKNAALGSYDFGYIDSTKYTGQLTWVPVSSQDFWYIPPGNYTVGSTSYNDNPATMAIADTGTSLLLMEDTVLSNYYSQVVGSSNDPNQGGYVFPCSSTLPSFNIQIGSNHATIPGTLMVYAAIDNTGTMCYGSLQSSSPIGLDIYGDIFFKACYVVFDKTTNNNRIGYAPHA